MHAKDVIEEVLGLADGGVTASETSRRTAIPRSTVRAWMRGELPRNARRDGSSDDRRCERCAGGAHRFTALPQEYVYLLGLYLGDGCIASHPHGVHRLRVTLDARYPGILDECESSIRTLLPANQVGRVLRGGGYANSRRGAGIEISSYSRSWPCLLPQHGPGRKHERPIVLVDWQRALVDRHPGALLRGLIHSDGCRFINTGTNWCHPRYSFSNASDDIRSIFCAACDRLGLRWTEAPRTVYVSRKADVAVLDRHIGPKR